MATVTPNFNWPVPTSTDLVKDGATAIEALGDSIDASLVDLKGGTSGQVLSKNSNTDMDFVWVTSDDANAIQNTIVDAKGDLITATAADTPARLAVGSNGETLVADSSTSTGLRYQENRTSNFIYNSNFDIWQRGTSFTNAGYLADRWNVDTSNSTISRQSTTPPAGATYYMRHTATAGSAYNNMRQYLETADVEQLQGKTVTLSIKLRRNATNTAPFILQLDKSVTTDAGSGATWVAVGTTNITNASIPTGTTTADWYTASLTVAVPNDGTANSLRFVFNYNALVASGSIIDIAQAMMQIGSVVGPYQRQNATIQGELAACQRYAFSPNYNPAGKALNNTISSGYASSTTAARITLQLPVAMRTQPSSTITFTGGYVLDNIASVPAITALSVNQSGTTTVLINATVASGLTSGQPVTLYSGSASDTLIIQAEL
jgi:hypothetical protein